MREKSSNKNKLLYDPNERNRRRLGAFSRAPENEETDVINDGEETESKKTEGQEESKVATNHSKHQVTKLQKNINTESKANAVEKVVKHGLKFLVKQGLKFLVKQPVFWFALIIIFIFLIIFLVLFSSSSAYASNGGNYSSACNTSTEDANLLTFINTFEGGESSCTTDDHYAGYKAYDGEDGTITIGHGITTPKISSSTSYIDQNGWGKYFVDGEKKLVNDKGEYILKVGTCIPIDVLDKIQIYIIETDYAASIDKYAEQYGVTLYQYQKDAITSFNYNLGSGYTEELISAYANGGDEGLWNEMKEYTHATIDGEYQELAGLKRRRKAEFALFITGDYTNTNPSVDDFDNYDSDGLMAQKMVCTSALGEDQIIDGMRLTRPLRDNPFYYNQETDFGALTGPGGSQTLEGECAWYATGRAKEYLSYINSPFKWTANTDGGKFCSTSDAQKFNQGDEPKAGSLISWDFGEWGHVAFVEKVNEDGTFDITEAGIPFGFYGKNARNVINSSMISDVRMVIRRDNCEKNNSGCFNYSANITKSKYNGFKCFIYLQEPKE